MVHGWPKDVLHQAGDEGEVIFWGGAWGSEFETPAEARRRDDRPYFTEKEKRMPDAFGIKALAIRAKLEA